MDYESSAHYNPLALLHDLKLICSQIRSDVAEASQKGDLCLLYERMIANDEDLDYLGIELLKLEDDDD